MSEEMRRDENVFLMGEDVGIFGGDFGTTVGMLEEFGEERVRDCPIGEAAIAGAAAGTIGRQLGKTIGKSGGKFGQSLGGNLGASLGRGILSTLFKL